MSLRNRIGLRARVLLTLGTLVLITVAGGLVMIWYTYRMEVLLTSVIRTNVASLQAAKGLEIALLNQRGYVSYFFLDSDPDWLRELGKHRQAFEERLKEAGEISEAGAAREILDRIESEYDRYTESKDRVIELYKIGEREAGARLHQKVRHQFFKVLKLCEEYNDLHNKKLGQIWAESQTETRRLRLIAGTAVSAAIIIGALLSFVLVTQVLEPIRRLAIMADQSGESARPGDEVATLKHSVHGLIENVDHTQLELERSRERLLQSEKMAVIGKLAAEVAHSIRNPMTSINMRLFSLNRTLELSPTQREDFAVISDEMRHLDNIISNFLEFSRPPRLKMQQINISDIVGGALQLLEKRLERNGIKVERQASQSLPTIEADPELLKEVFVNLIVNACDAMDKGGWLTITEEEAVAEHLGRVILIRLSDTGPGIPESIRDKILEPFFSSKEEGTGLGLSIASRIMEEHGGQLELHSEEGKGTTFSVILPIREEET